MTNHTDTSRSVTTLTAPMPLGIGTFVPPSAVVFFDGDSVIRINRNGTLELGPKWADAGDAAAAFFNELVSRVVPSWNARIEALEAEIERLRKMLPRMERVKGRDIDEWRSNLSPELYRAGDAVICWVNEGDEIAVSLARAALGEKQ